MMHGSLLRVATLTILLSVLVVVMMVSDPVLAATTTPPLNSAQLSFWWGLPFVGLILSIALFPLIAPHFWHRYFGVITSVWALAFLVPFTVSYGWQLALYESLYILMHDYLPFIILLGALYTVTSGVKITDKIVATPLINTGILTVGTGLASIMGTTGASMLLIRPLLQANEHRRYRTHIVIFFILLIANIGGSLTPLGDPPLFIGFLQGVPFFWFTEHMLAPMLLISGILIGAFYLVDRFLEGCDKRLYGDRPIGAKIDARPPTLINLRGSLNLLLLVGIVLAVLLRGFWAADEWGIIPIPTFSEYKLSIGVPELVSMLAMVGIAVLSLRVTRHADSLQEGFTWFPIQEVAKLFAGIFITIIPVIAILKAGEQGALSSVLALVRTPDGQPIDAMYFWLTGLLSAVIDNAPAYLIFFNSAGGDAGYLTTTGASTLLAISTGAVFMGAYTYIGNAPNFMVRSIAREAGVAMPSFFGYMGWTLLILTPLMFLTTWVFF